MLWHLPMVTDRTRLSTAMEKSTGDGMHPCIKPLFTLKGSVCWLLCMTRHSMFSDKDWMMLSNIFWIPWCRRIFHSDGRCRLSVAFPMSTNIAYRELFYSCDCSGIWRKTNMWSMHDFTFLKHALSWRSSLASAVVIRWRMPRRKTMLVMDRSVMLLQLLRLDRFRLFRSLMILPRFQTSAFTLLFTTSSRMCRRSCGISCFPDFCISACALSSSAALSFFCVLIASLTSWTEMSPS